ncbi:MAG: hypothetical protein HRT80_02765 [Henriciella sp.]|nr:hypothetical protein [Henriciella sp.]
MADTVGIGVQDESTGIMQTTTDVSPNRAPSYWMKGLPGLFANALCGVIAVFVAIKAITFEPGTLPGSLVLDHIVRIVSFAALTIWVTFAIGVRRRGAAAIIVLGFAAFLELVIVPIRATGLSTIASANLGIVFAYCAAQLYWFSVQSRKPDNRLHLEPAKD